MIKNTSPPLGSEPPTIDGFTFVRPIGSGSTANVYLYRQLDRNRPVAVKVGNVARHPQASARIAHEAHILGLLPQHPHILPLLAMGAAGPGLNYLVFEYASGGNCHSLLRTRETSCADMLRLGVKLADALCVVHRAGIVHRDIKPGNVLITAAGEPMLADFGTACSIYGADDACYSIPWSAPESLAHRKPCEGTDMYSLAALLYALLAGASPFEYGYRPRSSAQLRSIILSQPVPPLNHPDVPEPVELLLRRAMAKNPSDRFPSMPDFALELRRADLLVSSKRTMLSPVAEAPTGMAISSPRSAVPPRGRSATRSGHADRNRRSPWRKTPMAALSAIPLLLFLIVLAGTHTDSVQMPEPVHILDAEESNVQARMRIS